MSPNKVGRQVEIRQQEIETLATTPSRYSVLEVIETEEYDEVLEEEKQA